MSNTINQTADRIVFQEVLCCMSHIVSTLAASYGFSDRADKQSANLDDLCEQAFNLASPVLDYEEAAIQAGWSRNAHNGMFVALGHEVRAADYDSWQELCETHDIEPYEREVYEFWAVSTWFADKLISMGEQVDKDFAGLCVWARTTTGQGIAMDYVVQQIAKQIVG